MKRLGLAILFLLTGCAALPLLGSIAKAPHLDANVQAGRTNAQTIGVTDASSQAVTRSTVGTVHQSKDTSEVAAAHVDRVTINKNPPWLIIAFAAALFLDSPLRWPEEIMAALRRRKRPNT